MITVIFGTAHQSSIPGKQSPDGRFKEYKYSREIINACYLILKDLGYNVFIDVLEDDLKLSQSKELAVRCKIVNELCKQYKDCIYVSVHVNAAGNGSKWMNASGWEIYTSKGNTKADKLATCIYNAAKNNLKGKKLRTDFSDGDADKEADFYVLTHTKCPAVLTENFFQDNKEDVMYLESDEGFHEIVRTHVEGILNYIKDNS